MQGINKNVKLVFMLVLFLAFICLFSQNIQANASDERVRIQIVYNSQTFIYEDKIITPTDHLVAETITKRKINDSLTSKLNLVDKCINAGLDYKDAMLYCFPLLYKTVDKVKLAVDCEPIDSTITFSPSKKPMFTITREKNGFFISEAKIYQDIYIALRKSSGTKIVVIHPSILAPKVTYFDNIKLTNLRSKFTTDFAHSSENRKHNIRLALEKINGTVLEPNEEFSFNKIVGNRTEKRGFKTAKIILDGEYVDGVGGGVCQASTTVYNAAIRADMAITRVFNHSLVSSYVPPSFDAMVNSGTADLKFKNASDTPVFIKCYTSGDKISVEFFGTKLDYTIETESVVVMRSEPPHDEEFIDVDRKFVPSDLPAGERLRVLYGHGAIKSEGYLLYYDHSGRLIEKKIIRKDTYKSKRGLVAIAPEDSQEII